MRNGQALVAVLLVLGVALTVGMSVVSRSITEVGVSSTQDESARALSAAEAGIEKALGGIIAGTGSDTYSLTTTESYNVTRTVVGTNTNFVLPEKLVAGEVATLDGRGAVGGGKRVKVCWGQGVAGTDANAPAAEIIVYYTNTVSGGIYVTRVPVDPNAARRASTGNGFGAEKVGGTPCPATPDGGAFAFASLTNLNDNGNPDKLLLNSGDDPLLVRVRLLYNGEVRHPVGFRLMGWNLPAQGRDITSTGQSGGTTQKIRVTQLNPDMPPIFDQALFSGGSLVQ